MHRAASPALQHQRSVDYSRHGQGSPAQQAIPIFGLTVQRRPIQRVVRGANASRPIATHPDSITVGRLPVMARSGNSDTEHQAPMEGPDFSLMGDLTPNEIAASNSRQMTGLAVGVAGFVLLAFLWK